VKKPPIVCVCKQTEKCGYTKPNMVGGLTRHRTETYALCRTGEYQVLHAVLATLSGKELGLNCKKQSDLLSRCM